jgi:hypothetical protein
MLQFYLKGFGIKIIDKSWNPEPQAWIKNWQHSLPAPIMLCRNATVIPQGLGDWNILEVLNHKPYTLNP